MLDTSIMQALGGAVLTSLLAYAAVSDLRSRRIPNTLVLVLLGTGLAYSVVAGATSSVGAIGSELGRWAAGLAIGFALWIPLYVFRMLGAGDVKLFAAAAAWFGPMGAVRAALLSAVVGGVLSIVFMIWTRTSRVTLQRLGSWALVGAMGRWEAPRPAAAAVHQLPYGVAMAIGLTIAWWFPHLLSLR